MPAQGDSQYRSLVRQEVREIQEREKRRCSLVIKGLAATTPAGVVSEFGDLTSTMMGTRVTLTDVVKIPNNLGLWRAKVTDSDDRKLVLDRAKQLKGSQFDHIYIRRDLTYTQRMEMKERRETQRQDSAATQQQHSQGQGHETTQPGSPQGGQEGDQGHTTSPTAPSSQAQPGEEQDHSSDTGPHIPQSN